MAADHVLKRGEKALASSYCSGRIHFEEHFKADLIGERITLNICYEIFIRRAQEQLTKLPGNINISPHLEILDWGFKCSGENLCKCQYMCDVCSQMCTCTHRHGHSHMVEWVDRI